MKIVKAISLATPALMILTVFVGFLLPGETRIVRSIVINAPPATVFSLVNDFHEVNKWSPFAKRHPERVYDFEGPDSGAGTKVTWFNPLLEPDFGIKVIVESDLNSKVLTLFDFGSKLAYARFAYSQFNIEPKENSVKLIWSYNLQNGMNPATRYLGLMMEKWVSPDLELALMNIKVLAEEKT